MFALAAWISAGSTWSAEGTPTLRTEQPWKVVSLLEDAGLTHRNLFQVDFDRDPASPRRGTAWIATSDGLHEYDGYDWKRHGRAQGLPSNLVRCVLVTRAGQVWVGTDNGVARGDRNGFQTAGSEGRPAGKSVRRIVEDPDGTLWFCSDGGSAAGGRGGLTSLRGGQWTVYREADGLAGGSVVNYFRDRAGHAYAATLGGLTRWNGTRWEPEALPGDSQGMMGAMGSFAESPLDGLFHSNGLDLYRSDAAGWRLQPVPIHHEHGLCSLSDGSIVAVGRPHRGRSVFLEWSKDRWVPKSPEFDAPLGQTEDLREAPDGSVWVVGYACLVRWSRKEGAWREFANLPRPRLVDPVGGLWFAYTRRIAETPGPAVRLEKEGWRQLGESYDELRNNNGDRSIWGWNADRVTHWTGNTQTRFSARETGLAEVVAGRGDRAGEFWLLGTDSEGSARATRFSEGGWQGRRIPELAGLKLWANAAGAGTNGVWFAGDQGPGTEGVLVRVDGSRSTSLGVPADIVGAAQMDFIDDGRGGIWLFGDTGLFRWQLGRSTAWEPIPEMLSRRVVSAIQRSEELWFGCSGAIGGANGLVRWREGRWTRFPVDTLGNLSLAADSTVMANGTGQIFVVGSAPEALPVAVSLPTPEAVQGMIRAPDGSFWAAAGGTVFQYQPTEEPTETRVSGAARLQAGDPLVVVASAVERFTPRDSKISTRFSWRMDGGEWSEAAAGGRWIRSTEGLRVGLHRLEVRSVNFLSLADQTPAVLDFELVPVPLQQRRWFVPGLLGLAGVLGGMALVAGTARRRLAEYTRTLETKVTERTAELQEDIRQRTQAEAALRAGEERFSKAFNASPAILVITS